VRDVTLTVRTNGPATILVYRSTGSGVRQRIDTREVDGESTASFELTLNQYSDGGWIWFDVAADEVAIFEGATWSTETEPRRQGKASIGITTYNKPDYCIGTLAHWRRVPRCCRFWTACSSSIRAIAWCRRRPATKKSRERSATPCRS
jgi:galactofuranosylgalactofuranosylrhamnosyl-N-acetylglucosaminyl-diphospho-decaprenol beta-1,5/1,6-galactofuranosyltransferase